MTRDELLEALIAERFGKPTPPPVLRPAGPSALFEVLRELDGLDQEQAS